jgi:hypothetical protein
MRTLFSFFFFLVVLAGFLPAQVAFDHAAKPENIRGNVTLLDHASLNGKPGALLLIAQRYGGTYNPREVSAFYNRQEAKWVIANAGDAPMPPGALFNVLAFPEGSSNAFIHTADAANTAGHVTALNHALTNAKPGALVLVSHVGAAAGAHTVGVWYDRNQWKIYHEDRSPIPAGKRFVVAVLPAAGNLSGWGMLQGQGFIHDVTAATKAASGFKHVSALKREGVTGKDKAFVFANSAWVSAYNPNSTGVWYAGTDWTVFNQNRAELPAGARFHVAAVTGTGTWVMNPVIVTEPIRTQPVRTDPTPEPVKPDPRFNATVLTNPVVLSQAAVAKPVLRDKVTAVQFYDAAVKVDPGKMYILPYLPGATATPAQPAAPTSTEVQGPNTTSPKDIASLLPDPGLAQFFPKLNLFRELYEDKNPNSGVWYYLPSSYNLKWSPETGQYSFFIYYLSAGADGRGDVIITAELNPGINPMDIATAEKLISEKRGKPTRLVPLPLRDTPKIDFGNALTNFDVSSSSVSVNVPSDFLQPVIVTWKMSSRVEDLLGLMMSNSVIAANAIFQPFSETEISKGVPVRIKINDPQTFGKQEYPDAARLLNGFENKMDYPVVLTQLLVLREGAGGKLSVESIPLPGHAVAPKAFFSGFSQEVKDKLLSGGLVKKIWVDFSLQPCADCNQAVQQKILGGTSASRVQEIEVQSLTPLAVSGAHSMKVLIRTKQGDPNGANEVTLPMVTITEDGATYPGGDLFLDEGEAPAYSYQLVLIKADGEVKTSEWMEGNSLFLVIGESAIRTHFPE